MKYLLLLANSSIYEHAKTIALHRLKYFNQNIIYNNQLIKDYNGIIFFNFTKNLKTNINKK